MAAFYTFTRGATLPGAAAILMPRATARRGPHRIAVVTAICGAIGQFLLCVWCVLALGLWLLVLAGFFTR